MIRRLEKKVTNGIHHHQLIIIEKRMAQSGGYDLSDPFIDDGNLVSQSTAVNVYLYCICS